MKDEYIHIRLSSRMKRDFKKQCAKRGQSMSERLIYLITKDTEENANTGHSRIRAASR